MPLCTITAGLAALGNRPCFQVLLMMSDICLFAVRERCGADLLIG